MRVIGNVLIVVNVSLVYSSTNQILPPSVYQPKQPNITHVQFQWRRGQRSRIDRGECAECRESMARRSWCWSIEPGQRQRLRRRLWYSTLSSGSFLLVIFSCSRIFWHSLVPCCNGKPGSYIPLVTHELNMMSRIALLSIRGTRRD
jgi:hypothetical protein